MEAGMSALSATEAPITDGPESVAVQVTGPQLSRRALRLVPQPDTAGPSKPASRCDDQAEPRSSSIGHSAHLPLIDAILTPSAVIPPRSRTLAAQPPLRLTRRGRVVVATLVVAAVAVLALAIALATAGGAQAAGHGGRGGLHQGMHQIVVRPGQTLWSIASAAEPTADPRLVVPEIMAANGLTSADIAAGQLLWVPR
jgi:hypothetical protein